MNILKNKHYLSIFCLVFVCVTGCRQKQNFPVSQSQYFDNLNNQIIKSIDKIVDERTQTNRFLFLFNFHDCQNCVEAGLFLSKAIDSIAGERVVFPVATMVNPTNFQSRTSYFEYIYYDYDDIIRKELKFIPTPLLILLNSDNKVVSSFIPRDTINLQATARDLYDSYLTLF